MQKAPGNRLYHRFTDVFFGWAGQGSMFMTYDAWSFGRNEDKKRRLLDLLRLVRSHGSKILDILLFSVYTGNNECNATTHITKIDY